MPDKRDSTSAYAKPSEDSSSMLERLDFSQAFKSTHLGTALCFTNPMHQKFLDKSLKDHQKQKQRRGVALYHNQRTFFISQVFEKGLNPYLNKGGKENKKSGSHTSNPQHSQSARMSKEYRYDSAHYEEDTVRKSQRPHTQSTSNAAKKDNAENLPILRSKTQGDMKQQKKSVQVWDYTTEPRSGKRRKGSSSEEVPQVQKSSASKPRRSSRDAKTPSNETLPVIPNGPQKTKQKSEVLIVTSPIKDRTAQKLPKLSEEDDDGDNDDEFSEFSHDCESIDAPEATTAEHKEDDFDLSMNTTTGPTRAQRRDIAFLKRNPGMLFPKMNELIVRDLLGENEPFDLEAEQAKQTKKHSLIGKDVRKMSTVKVATEPTKKRKPKKEKKEESTPIDYVKLIQKLTAYLPDHLAETAKDQIREMTQTEAIYEQKEQILNHNKSKLRRELTIGDQRWEKLEGALSSNHGEDNAKWRRVRPTGAWIKIQEY